MRATLIALGLAAGLLSAPAQAARFTWAAPADAISFDPHALNDTFSQALVNNVYEALVRHGTDLKVGPALAESWETPEPTRWRFHLRPGVRFHDGKAFTADDVVFSWERTNTPGALALGKLDMIRGVTAVDERTVDVRLKYPFPILPQTIANWFMMSRGWAEANDARMSSNLAASQEGPAGRRANGTGPFMLALREPGIRTVLQRNPAWWDQPRHNLDEVVFQQIANDSTRTAALLSGGVDAILPVPLQDVERLRRQPGVQLLERPELRTVYFGFNQGSPEIADSSVRGRNPFTDRRVRQAVYQAIDADAIRTRIMRGAAAPAGILVAPEINGFAADLNTRLPYDPAAAKRLLTEAGYPEGFEVGLNCPVGVWVSDEAICQAVGTMLSRIGITVRPRFEPRARWAARINSAEVAMFMQGHAGLPTVDAYSTLSETMATRAGAMGGLNAGRYSNPEFDRVLAQVAAEPEGPRRQALIHEALAIEKADIAHVPLHQQPLVWGARPGVTLVQTPDNRFRLWHVRMD